MASFLKRLRDDRRGNALVIAAAALPLVLGSAGLASDTIQWALWKRQLQRAADSAAIAGVYAKFQDQGVNEAVSTDLTKNNQTGISLVSGYPQVSEPASTSQWNNAVRVGLAVQKRLGFSSLFLTSVPVIEVEATAAAIETGEYCVVSLESTNTTGISVGGTATVDLGCGMITNSTSLDAAIAFGDSVVNASPIAAVGGISASDNWASGTELLPFTLAQEDPFKDVHPTEPTGCEKFSSYDLGNNNKPGGIVDLTAQSGTICIKEAGGTLDIKGDVRLGSATYVLDATSLKMTNSSAKLSCNGCTIVLTSSTADTDPGSIGSVSLQGGEVDLIAPSTGPYQGIAIYQDRRALGSTSSSAQNLINGNSESSFQGAFYFPSQQMTFNGTTGMSTECVQIVARRVELAGNAEISNNCPPGSGADSFKGRHVRLVA